MPMGEVDVVVVGAGPAGASTAFFLKHLDRDCRVLLIDRLDGERYARYHRMCGEGISRDAFKQLSPLGPEAVVHNIRRARETWPGGITLETRAIGYIIDRPRFLRSVLSRYRALGGEREVDAVGSVSRDGSRYRLACTSGRTYLCNYLVGADGAHSVVRRQVFHEEPPVMLWTEQHIVDKDIDKETIQFFQDERYKGGYRWEFPAGRYARIGFPRGTDHVEGEVIESHRRAIPLGGVGTVQNGNALLVGDSAAMPNPLTAGGIRPALVSGRMAAEAIVRRDLSSYPEWWKASVFSSPKFMAAFRDFQRFSNADLDRAARPLRHGYNPLSYLWAWLSKPEYRTVYAAYRLSGIYGW